MWEGEHQGVTTKWLTDQGKTWKGWGKYVIKNSVFSYDTSGEMKSANGDSDIIVPVRSGSGCLWGWWCSNVQFKWLNFPHVLVASYHKPQQRKLMWFILVFYIIQCAWKQHLSKVKTNSNILNNWKEKVQKNDFKSERCFEDIRNYKKKTSLLRGFVHLI